ncbi:transcriptional regulator [Nitratireductor sp. CAU 1489]|uniref:Transcriptional regulator n=1 Tax=Nitratireductor arenosus TaxID=2682096 RepID=A0A844QK71_9HYPH|nr:transcriptional regulator [Nitratireductor arenosus]MVA99657.1 transcriptional regulator [Nitratireductor arenosus]
MPRTTIEAERERQRAEDQALTNKYRAIGPAAILAALVCLKAKENNGVAAQGGRTT